MPKPTQPAKFKIYKLRVFGSHLYVGDWHVATLHEPYVRLHATPESLYKISQLQDSIRRRNARIDKKQQSKEVKPKQAGKVNH